MMRPTQNMEGLNDSIHTDTSKDNQGENNQTNDDDAGDNSGVGNAAFYGWYDQPRPPASRIRYCCSLAKRGLWCIAATVIIVVCLLIVVLVVVQPKETKDGPSRSNLTDTADTNELLGRQRFVLFRSALARSSEPAAFVDPNSPQSQALKWLVYQDTTLDLLRETGARVGWEDVSSSSNTYLSEEFQWRLEQRYALMVFSFSTNGAGWRGIVPWEDHTTVMECQPDFEGVECDRETGEVVRMDLGFRKVSGRIPDEIGLLTKLTTLDLSRNLLEGRIPFALYYHLTNLENLSLEGNEIAFSLHDDIGRLTNMKYLSFTDTFLAGSLPSSLAKLTELRDFSVAKTQLSGNLFEVALHWKNIEILIVDKSGLSGTIPSEIGLFSNLHTLGLHQTRIRGGLPTEVGMLTNLKEIIIGGEGIKGSIPSEIGGCTNMNSLVFATAGSMSGNLPSTIGELSLMTYLAIIGSNIGGTLPTEIGRLTMLENINIEANQFTGTLPSEVANMQALNILQINFNDLSGTIPLALCDKSEMVVWMNCNRFSCENDCCPEGWCT